MGLKSQLMNTCSLDGRLELLNEFVRKLARLPYLPVNKEIIFATQTIQKNRGLFPLKRIQSELNMTERTFQRLFESHVGVSPKLFGRICQFQSAFQQVSQLHQINQLHQGNQQYSGLQNHSFRLSDIAYENGYADQSHFIRVFREFTNHPPRDYFKGCAESPELAG
jgi:AraC-like DNA-binding protein